MSGLASIEAQFRQHRNAYLAGAAGLVVVLALRARGRTAKQDTPVPTTMGNPAGPYDGTTAAIGAGSGSPVDLSPIQQQLAGLSQQLTDYATIGMPPSPLTIPAGTPAPTIITAPAGSLPITPTVPVTPPAGGSTVTAPPGAFTPSAPAPTPKPTAVVMHDQLRWVGTIDTASRAKLAAGQEVTRGNGYVYAMSGPNGTGVPVRVR